MRDKKLNCLLVLVLTRATKQIYKCDTKNSSCQNAIRDRPAHTEQHLSDKQLSVYFFFLFLSIFQSFFFLCAYDWIGERKSRKKHRVIYHFERERECSLEVKLNTIQWMCSKHAV